jgi:hypothetical protein
VRANGALIGSEIPSNGRQALAQLHAARARCHDDQNCRADFQRWAWLITVRVRTTCPRLRPVEPGAQTSSNHRSGRGKVFTLGECARARGFTRPIKVKDHPGVSCAIHQASGLLLAGGRGEWATLEIGKSTGCVGLRRVPLSMPLANRDSAEREGNRSRSGLRHERDGKRLEPLGELFQRAFEASGVAKEHRQKIDHPRTRPKRLRAKRTCSFISASYAVRTKIPAHHDDFSAPSTGARSWTPNLSGFLPHSRRYWSYPDLLVENGWDLSHQGGIVLRRLATGQTSLLIGWDERE